MLRTELLLTAALSVAPCALLAQESLTPLSARPVPQAAEALRKNDGLNLHFNYINVAQGLPIQDDFSIDRTRKRWAQPDDPNVTLMGTIYRLEVAGVSEPDMVYMLDTTFTYMTDTVGPDTTVRTPLPEVTVLVRDVTVYPPTETTEQAWPAYNILDTVQSPSPDILYITGPDLVQDSLMTYDVAPDPSTYIQPDNSIVPLVLWEDDDVYINGNYPIEPPTIGVATFDGLARTGYPYNFPQYTSYGIADHLTTVPIDLSAPLSPADSVYLSFFYQPQGLSGDGNPQPVDSLVLEFYSDVSQYWYHAWSTPYVAMQPFQQILIPITDALFFTDTFRFRFRNYSTLSGSFDHWHLDYVRLGAQRTFDDVRLIDVAYMYPEVSLMQTYTTVTFNKFEESPASYMASSITALQRNLDEEAFIEYGFMAKEEDEPTWLNFDSGLNTSGNQYQIFSSTHAINSAPANFTYDPSLSTDAAFWRVKLWTNATPDINRYNDTVTFIQEISNYMSYDDGTAEMGYGLLDAGNALAYRFDIVGGDSLRAIRMYFNPQANDPQSSLNPYEGRFLLSVWTDLSQEPVFQNFTQHSPQYRLDGIDHFVEYPLDETIWVQGTFYVGFVQTTDVRMNLGFDRNRNNQNKIFYKTTGGFTNTSFAGSLMMRPVFVAAVDPFASVEDVAPTGSQLALVPNPANDAVLLRCAEAIPGTTVQCMDAMGRMVKQEAWMAERALAVGDLNAGLYIVRLVDADGRAIAQERLLIQR